MGNQGRGPVQGKAFRRELHEMAGELDKIADENLRRFGVEPPALSRAARLLYQAREQLSEITAEAQQNGRERDAARFEATCNMQTFRGCDRELAAARAAKAVASAPAEDPRVSRLAAEVAHIRRSLVGFGPLDPIGECHGKQDDSRCAPGADGTSPQRSSPNDHTPACHMRALLREERGTMARVAQVIADASAPPATAPPPPPTPATGRRIDTIIVDDPIVDAPVARAPTEAERDFDTWARTRGRAQPPGIPRSCSSRSPALPGRVPGALCLLAEGHAGRHSSGLIGWDNDAAQSPPPPPAPEQRAPLPRCVAKATCGEQCELREDHTGPHTHVYRGLNGGLCNRVTWSRW